MQMRQTCELRGSENVNLQRHWVALELKTNDAALRGILGDNACLFVKLPQSCSMD
jgi:hypothetical protein